MYEVLYKQSYRLILHFKSIANLYHPYGSQNVDNNCQGSQALDEPLQNTKW